MKNGATGTEQPGSDSDNGAGLRAIAYHLRRLHRAHAIGELAELRRMEHTKTPPAAFFRLLARAGFVEMSDVDNVRRWAGAVRVMAQRPDALRTDIELGKALHRIGLSEQRLDVLLNARGNTLFQLVRRVSLRLAQADEAMPYGDLCWLLLLSDPRDQVEEQKAEKLRIQIAQGYVRAALSASRKNAEAN